MSGSDAKVLVGRSPSSIGRDSAGNYSAPRAGMYVKTATCRYAAPVRACLNRVDLHIRNVPPPDAPNDAPLETGQEAPLTGDGIA